MTQVVFEIDYCVKCVPVTGQRVIDFIEGNYNTCRSHSALGYLSPRDYEEGLLHAT